MIQSQYLIKRKLNILELGETLAAEKLVFTGRRAYPA